MATEVTEITGQSGRLHVDGTRRYQRVFEVFFDSVVMNPYEVCTLSQLPAAQSPHPHDSGSFCVGVEAKQDSDRARGEHWIVTFDYSERQASSVEDLFSGQGQDPELRQVDVSWQSNQIQRFSEYDYEGFRICNSAGDPPVRPEPYFEPVKICNLKYFVRYKPAGLMELVNCINANSFTIDGEYVAEKCARVADISVTPYGVTRGVIGRNISVTLEIGKTKSLKANSVVWVGSSALTPSTQTLGFWEPAFLDRGRRVYDSTLNGGSGGLATVTNDDGTIPDEPALLNGKGVALTKPVAQGSECWRFYSRYQPIGFELIRLPTF